MVNDPKISFLCHAHHHINCLIKHLSWDLKIFHPKLNERGGLGNETFGFWSEWSLFAQLEKLDIVSLLSAN